MHVGIALSPMHLAEPPALPSTPHADQVAEFVTGTPDAKAPPVTEGSKQEATQRLTENKNRPTLLM